VEAGEESQVGGSARASDRRPYNVAFFPLFFASISIRDESRVADVARVFDVIGVDPSDRQHNGKGKLALAQIVVTSFSETESRHVRTTPPAQQAATRVGVSRSTPQL
jgi:hypothetical protein